MTTLTQEEDVARRPATMRDVAALADVSIKTVSRVVNQEPGVSSELIDRVMNAVRLLGYHHNTTASNLRRADQRTATIGLLLDDVANPFSSALHRAIEEVARQHDTLVFAGSSDEDPRPRRKNGAHACVAARRWHDRRADQPKPAAGLCISSASTARSFSSTARRFFTAPTA